MGELFLLQDLNKNIRKIRLFQNNVMNNNIDENKIELFYFEDITYLFVPENLCVFKIPYKIISVSEISKIPNIRKAIRLGLIPLENCRSPLISSKNATKTIGIQFLITSLCNMNCNYCIFNNNQNTKFDDEFNLENCVNKIKEIVKIIRPEKIDFTFTGGEPLLKFERIKKLVEFIVPYCSMHKINYSFQITTNGSIIDEQILSFISKMNMRVSISLDGDAFWYQYSKDERYKYFDVIIKNIDLIQKFCYCTVRATIENSPQFLEKRIEYLYSIASNNLSIQPDITKIVSSDTVNIVLGVDENYIRNKHKIVNSEIKKYFSRVVK